MKRSNVVCYYYEKICSKICRIPTKDQSKTAHQVLHSQLCSFLTDFMWQLFLLSSYIHRILTKCNRKSQSERGLYYFSTIHSPLIKGSTVCNLSQSEHDKAEKSNRRIRPQTTMEDLLISEGKDLLADHSWISFMFVDSDS